MANLFFFYLKTTDDSSFTNNTIYCYSVLFCLVSPATKRFESGPKLTIENLLLKLPVGIVYPKGACFRVNRDNVSPKSNIGFTKQFTVSKNSLNFEIYGLVQIKSTLKTLKVYSERRI